MISYKFSETVKPSYSAPATATQLRSKCEIIKIDYSRPVVIPKKGITMAALSEEWEADQEFAKELSKAREWLASEVSKADGGVTLRSLRLCKGLSQIQLACMMGMQQPNIARLEKGRDGLALETMRKLSSALGVDMNTIDIAVRNQEMQNKAKEQQ